MQNGDDPHFRLAFRPIKKYVLSNVEDDVTLAERVQFAQTRLSSNPAATLYFLMQVGLQGYTLLYALLNPYKKLKHEQQILTALVSSIAVMHLFHSLVTEEHVEFTNRISKPDEQRFTRKVIV